MKIREGFVLRDVAGKTIVIATGELSKEYHAIMTMNETGKLIWQCLEKGMSEAEVVDAILAECEDATREVVEKDVSAFVDKLKKVNIVE